ncbi:MAG TPA: hypothetical protein ACQGQF_06805 [Xylella fastidiosa subsp. pauca]
MINATHGCRATTHGPTRRAICTTSPTLLATATPLIWTFWRCTTGVRPSLQCMVIVALWPPWKDSPLRFPTLWPRIAAHSAWFDAHLGRAGDADNGDLPTVRVLLLRGDG